MRFAKKEQQVRLWGSQGRLGRLLGIRCRNALTEVLGDDSILKGLTGGRHTTGVEHLIHLSFLSSMVTPVMKQTKQLRGMEA